MIIPRDYPTFAPFRNRTHLSVATTGTVVIGVDWELSIESIRARLLEVLRASPNWDGRKAELHVEDASGYVVQLVAVVSAADGDALGALRWEVREALVDFIRREHADALPRQRQELEATLVTRDPTADSDAPR